MDQLNQIVLWIENNKELFEVLIILLTAVWSQATTAIAQVHKISIDAEKVVEMSDEDKRNLAVTYFVTYFGKQCTWLYAIPGVQGLVTWIIQSVYDKIKPVK